MYIKGSNNNSELVKERTKFKTINCQGLEMTCIEYNNAFDIIVEFENPYYKTKNNWGNFKNGNIKNPYYPSVYGVGIVGEYLTVNKNGKRSKEYVTWCGMLERVYRDDFYKDCSICNEWLIFENFYNWLHSQSNFDKWLNNNKWNVDKDIIVKGNKVYSPDTCCLVPSHVNTLFLKSNKARNDLPIGVRHSGNKYMAICNNSNSRIYLGTYDNLNDAFCAYKEYKEKLIKMIAQEQYNIGNITKQCYDAMMKYKVEITD